MVAAHRRLRGGDMGIDLWVLRVENETEQPERHGGGLKRNLQSASNLQSAIRNLQFHSGVAV